LKKGRKYILIVCFFSYCVFILWITVLKRQPRTERKMVLEVFWSFRQLILGRKNGRSESIQYLNNILFFLPFGFLFPWKGKGWKVHLFVAIGFSVTIELLQYFFILGWCELDDVISNTVGAVIGYAAYNVTKLVGEKHKWKEF
jgi:glycopeptide antibiotics resistance protein